MLSLEFSSSRDTLNLLINCDYVLLRISPKQHIDLKRTEFFLKNPTGIVPWTYLYQYLLNILSLLSISRVPVFRWNNGLISGKTLDFKWQNLTPINRRNNGSFVCFVVCLYFVLVWSGVVGFGLVHVSRWSRPYSHYGLGWMRVLKANKVLPLSFYCTHLPFCFVVQDGLSLREQ